MTIKTHYETKVSNYKYGDSANIVQAFVLKLKVLYQYRIKDDKIIRKGHNPTTGYTRLDISAIGNPCLSE
jgi:hypothetical protein